MDRYTIFEMLGRHASKEEIKEEFKLNDEQVELLLKTSNLSVIDDMLFLIRSGVNMSLCEKISDITTEMYSFFSNHFFKVVTKNEIINSKYYEYIINKLADASKTMNEMCFYVLTNLAGNNSLIKSDYYETVIEAASNINNLNILSEFSCLVLFELPYLPNTEMIQQKIIVWSKKTNEKVILGFRNNIKDIISISSNEISMHTLDLLDEIDDENLLNEICKMAIDLKCETLIANELITIASKITNVDTLNGFRNLVIANDVNHSIYGKNAVSNSEILISIIEKLNTLNEEKEIVYTEIKKVLNLDNSLVVAETLKEINADLKIYIKTLKVLKGKLYRPAEERIKKYSLTNN